MWPLLACLVVWGAAERVAHSQVFFVNPAYGFREGGHLRVNVSRSGVGVSGLDKKKLIPCLPDAEVLQNVVLREASAGKHLLDSNSFEYTRVSPGVLDVLRTHRSKFGNTIGDVFTVADCGRRQLPSALGSG
jgi:hypothetical protein